VQTVFKSASTFIFWVAVFGPSQWTKCCLHCSCALAGGLLDGAAVVLLHSDALVPCCGDCGVMIWWCQSEEEDDNKKEWKVLMKMITKRSVLS
jgi:hypothetical protein